MGMQSSFVFPICIMASTMMVTEDISSCEDMEPMDSVIAVHIVFLSIRFVQIIPKSIKLKKGERERFTKKAAAQTGRSFSSKWTIRDVQKASQFSH